MIDDKFKDIIEAYDLNVISMNRIRGAFLCHTTDGLKILKVYPYSENHIVYESMIKYVLNDRGYSRLDIYMYNKDGQLLTNGSDGNKYVIKQWYEGNECNLKNQEQIKISIENLAILHKSMQNVRFECAWTIHAQAQPTDVLMRRRIRELKTIYNYIKGKKAINAFEQLYIEYYDHYSRQAKAALKILEEIDYGELYSQTMENRIFCHGDYSHHHVLLGREGAATVNLDKSLMNHQMNDLYYFMRKALEKNDWDLHLGNEIIKNYTDNKSISYREERYLYALLLFPEKFWKISNHYYNSRKSWTSSVNFEKLKKCIYQENMRQSYIGSAS